VEGGTEVRVSTQDSCTPGPTACVGLPGPVPRPAADPLGMRAVFIPLADPSCKSWKACVVYTRAKRQTSTPTSARAHDNSRSMRSYQPAKEKRNKVVVVVVVIELATRCRGLLTRASCTPSGCTSMLNEHHHVHLIHQNVTVVCT